MKKAALLEDIDAKQTGQIVSCLAYSLSILRPRLVDETASSIYSKYGDSKLAVPLDEIETFYRRSWEAALSNIDAAKPDLIIVQGAASFLLSDVLRDTRDARVIVLNPLLQGLEGFRPRASSGAKMTWVCFSKEEGFRANKIFNLHKRAGGDLHIFDETFAVSVELKCGIIREIHTSFLPN